MRRAVVTMTNNPLRFQRICATRLHIGFTAGALALLASAAPAQAQADGPWSPAKAWSEAQRLSPQLRAADATADAAKARIDIARIPQIPTAAIEATHSESTANFVARPGSVPKSFSSTGSTFSLEPFGFWHAGASSRWTFADFGRTSASVNAADHAAQAAGADARSIRRQVWLQVMSAYQLVLTAEAGVVTAKETRDQSAQRRELAKSRVEARVRPPLDLARAESDLASAEVAVLRGEEQVRAARIALAVAIGLTQAVAGPLAPLSLPDAELTDERLQSAEALDKWTDSAAAERPEIVGLAQRHQAALAELAVVQKTANPSLYLGASATLAGTQLAAMAFNLGLTAGVTWPISGMWLASPQIAEVRARIRALDGQEQSLRLSVRGELDAARTAVAQARKRRPALATLQQFANQAYEQAKVRYTAGASTMTEVIDAASAVSQARLQLLQADLDEALGVARWWAAMGRLPE